MLRRLLQISESIVILYYSNKVVDCFLLLLYVISTACINSSPVNNL